MGKALALLALLTVGNFFNIVDKNVMSLFMPVIRQDVTLSSTEAGLILGFAFVLVVAVVALPISRLADVRGPRVVIAVGLLAWSAATYLCGLATGFASLFGARMMVGAGESGFQPAAHAALAATFSPRNLGRALSVFALGAGVAQVFGYYGSALFVDEVGWRGTFKLLGIAGVVLAVIAWFSWPYIASSTVPKPVAPGSERLGFIATLRMLLRIPAFFFLMLGAVIHAIAAYSVGQWVPSFLQEHHGMSLKEAGLWIGAVFSVGSVAGNVGTGFLIDRFHENKLVKCLRLCAISSILTLPFYLTGFLFTDVHILILLPAYILAAVYLAPTYLVLQNLVPAEHRAVANAIVITLFTVVGLGVGPVLTGGGSDIFKALGVENHLGAAMSIGAGLNLISAAFYLVSESKLRRSGMSLQPAE